MAQALQLVRTGLLSGTVDDQDVNRGLFERCLRTEVRPCITMNQSQWLPNTTGSYGG